MSSTVPPPTSPSSASARRVFDAVKTPITLLVLLGILAFGAWYGYKQVTKPGPTEPPVPCTTTSGKTLTSKQVTVTAHNGGSKRGLAREVANNLRAKGFILRPSQNSDERITRTIVRGAKVDSPEVKLVAGFFKNPKIEADNRIDGTVDVLVGNDFEGMNLSAPVQIAITEGACVAPTTTPTPSPAG